MTVHNLLLFSQVDKEDVSIAGENGANLGEIVKAGLNIAPGFIITSHAYFDFVRENNFALKINHLLSTINFSQQKSLDQVSKHIKKIIIEGRLSEGLVKEIVGSYRKLGGVVNEPQVSLRVSPTANDLNNSTSAVPQESSINIKGDAVLIEKIKEAWAYLYDSNVIFYRHQNRFENKRIGIALIVQKIIEPEKLGKMFTIDRATNDKNKLVIEPLGGLKKLSDQERDNLNTVGEKIKRHYYFPQEIDWVIEKGKIYVSQIKSITTTDIQNNQRNASELSDTVVQSAYASDTETTNTKTATKVYVNLSEPDLSENIAQENTDGVGLLKAEYMLGQTGIHPKKILRDGKEDSFVDKLSVGISTVCKNFDPRPVIYRTSNFKTNDYRNLTGGRDYEPIEENPAIGFRGAFRYIHNRDIFNLELRAIKKVREEMGYKNLSIMLPFVRTVEELLSVKKMITDSGLSRSATFKIWMVVEIPSNVIMLEKFIDAGVDGVFIDMEVLTMLTLGIDRDNQELAGEFDEVNPAIVWSVEHIIKTAHKKGIPSSISGQALSTHSELLKRLIRLGVTSVSVLPGDFNSTRKLVAYFEKEILRNGKN